MQDRRDQADAERTLRRMPDGENHPPQVIVTDKRASHPPAIQRVVPTTEHRQHKGLNNQAENSHRPVRKRERVL